LKGGGPSLRAAASFKHRRWSSEGEGGWPCIRTGAPGIHPLAVQFGDRRVLSRTGHCFRRSLIVWVDPSDWPLLRATAVHKRTGYGTVSGAAVVYSCVLSLPIIPQFRGRRFRNSGQQLIVRLRALRRGPRASCRICHPPNVGRSEANRLMYSRDARGQSMPISFSVDTPTTTISLTQSGTSQAD
jgi:hypothetical protein